MNEGRGERVLHRFLGEVDISEMPNEHGDGPAVFGPEDRLNPARVTGLEGGGPFNARRRLVRPGKPLPAAPPVRHVAVRLAH
jgi:hypothetical protein